MLTENVIKKVNEIGEVEDLQTNNKDSIVDAINELFQNANNGKKLIANAIGSPLSIEDTFNAMSEKINNIKDNFMKVLIDEGVDVSDEDSISTLINKMDNEFDRQVIPEGTANAEDVLLGKTFINSTGKVISGTANGGSQYASGTFDFSTSFSQTITYDPGFTPTMLFVKIPQATAGSYGRGRNLWVKAGSTVWLEDVGSYTLSLDVTITSSTQFKISAASNSNRSGSLTAGTGEWIAFK